MGPIKPFASTVNSSEISHALANSEKTQFISKCMTLVLYIKPPPKYHYQILTLYLVLRDG